MQHLLEGSAYLRPGNITGNVVFDRVLNTTLLKVLKALTLLSANPKKWSNTLKQFVGKLSTNCLSVFHNFVGLALNGLIKASTMVIILMCLYKKVSRSGYFFLLLNLINKPIKEKIYLVIKV